jgi:parallel beta-helix repeat protein
MALRRVLIAALCLAAPALVPGSASAADAGACTKVASPGPDAAQELANSLRPGEVGCLHAGTYAEDVTIEHGGSGESSRIVLRSYPGERATLLGRLYVPDRSNFVTIESLDLNGSTAPSCGTDCRLPSPTVNGDDILFQDNDVTNDHTSICFAVGNPGWGMSKRTVIRRNRIHNCGVMPAKNHDHGIYLTDTEDVQILDNVIYDNADRGIQFYPDADRTIVRGNIVDGNGQGIIFSGVGGDTSDDNIVENNIFTNARIRFNIESWWPDGEGTGNVARNNCVYGGKQGNIAAQDGFTAVRNIVADPLYVDRAGKDFRLRPGSPCAAILAGAEAPALPIDTGDPEKAPAGADTGSTGTEGSTDTTRTSPGKPGQPILENVSLKRKRAKRGRRAGYRLRVAGHITGFGADELLVQVRRGASWRTLTIVRDVRHHFRVVLNPELDVTGVRSAASMKVRVVIPGVGVSNAVRARAVR